MAEADAAAREVVRRHLDDHPIADAGADAEFAHLAGGVSQHLVLVIELHTEIAVRQHLCDGAVELEHLFLRHSQNLRSARRTVAGLAARLTHECNIFD